MMSIREDFPLPQRPPTSTEPIIDVVLRLTT
jgi:hypothetical protein